MASKYSWGAGNQLKHILIAEKVLGHSLPNGAEVHHIDGNGKNNSHSNLVICPNHAYHFMLHRRMRALEECGNANWAKCVLCKTWDDTKNLTLKKAKMVQYYHKQCAAFYRTLQTKKSYADFDIEKYKPGYVSKH